MDPQPNSSGHPEHHFLHLIAIPASILAAVLFIGTSYWVYKNYSTEGVVCTEEAKLCPDGLYVGRTGPNCEFVPCPSSAIDTSAWKTYRNEEYGYEIKYPPEWQREWVSEQVDFYQVNFSHSQVIGDLKDIYAEFSISAKEVSSDFIDLWNKSLIFRAKELKEIGGVKVKVIDDPHSPITYPEGKFYQFVQGRIYYQIFTVIRREDQLKLYQDLFTQILSTFKLIE